MSLNTCQWFFPDKLRGVYKMSDYLFLKIISREIPVDIVYEDDDVLEFRDQISIPYCLAARATSS